MHGGEEARRLGGVIFTEVVSQGHVNPSTDNWKLPGGSKHNFFN